MYVPNVQVLARTGKLAAALCLLVIGCRSPTVSAPHDGGPGAAPRPPLPRLRRAIGLASPERLALALNQGPVTQVNRGLGLAATAVSQNGRRVAMGHGRLLTLMSPGTELPLARAPELPGFIQQVFLSKTGARAAASTTQQPPHLHLFNGGTGAPLASLPLQLPTDGWVKAQFSPDEKVLAWRDCAKVGADRCILERLHLMDAATGKELPAPAMASAPILDMGFSKDGALFVLQPGSLRFFSLPDMATLPTAAGTDETMCAAALTPSADGQPEPWSTSPDGRLLAHPLPPARICLWELDQRRVTKVVDLRGRLPPGSPSAVLGIVAEGRGLLVSLRRSAQPARTALYDVTAGRVLTTLEPVGEVYPVADGSTLVSVWVPVAGHSVSEVLTLKRITRDLVVQAVPLGEADRAAELSIEAVSTDGRYLAMLPHGSPLMAETGVIVLADLSQSPAKILRLESPAPLVSASLAFDQSRGELVYADQEMRVRTYALPSGQVRYDSPRWPFMISDLSFRADGQELAIASLDGFIYTFSLATGHFTGAVAVPVRRHRDIHFREARRLQVCWRADGTLRVMSTEPDDPSRLFAIEPRSADAKAVPVAVEKALRTPFAAGGLHWRYDRALFGDCRYAAFSGGGELVVVELPDGAVKDPLSTPQFDYGAPLASQPGTTTLIYPSADKRVTFWDAATGHPVRELNTPDKVASLAADAGGRFLIVQSDADDSYLVLDAHAGSALAKLPAQGASTGAGSAVVSPDGRCVALRDPLGRVSLHSLPDGQKLWQSADSIDSPVYSLAFTPDSTRIVIGGLTGSLLWMDASDGKTLLRMQLLPDQATATALAWAPSEQFEWVTTSAKLTEVAGPENYVVCQLGAQVVGFSLCRDALFAPGLTQRQLAPRRRNP